MTRWQNNDPHELDKKSTEECIEIENGHDPETRERHRRGLIELRDVSKAAAQSCETALYTLRQSWTGSGADTFAAEFTKIIDILNNLGSTAATERRP